MFDGAGQLLGVLADQRQWELRSRWPALRYQGDSADTVAIVTLYPGSYTFHIYDTSFRTGGPVPKIGLFEIYDLSFAPKPFP